MKVLEEKNARMTFWKHRIFTFFCLCGWFVVVSRVKQKRSTIVKIQLIRNEKIPKYSGEVLIKRMDGLEFRSQISDISVKDIKVTENSALLRVNVDKFNPLNQMANYDASKTDKATLKSRHHDIMMDNFALEKTIPDLLFAVATSHAEGIFLFDQTKK